MKTRTLFVIIAFAILSLSSCTKESANNKVAVFIPSGEVTERWKTDKSCLAEALSTMNLDYTIYTADEGTGAETQINQISSAINSGVKTLIITPINYNTLLSSKVLEGKSDLKIICHDRMLYNCNEVNAYSACNNTIIGEYQASFLVQALAASGKSSMTLEMLAGPVEDNNSKAFFDGAWKILKTYVDKGKITIPSGKKTYDAVAMASWNSSDAKSAMKSRLDTYYPDGGVPNLILAPNDNAAIGAVQAIEAHSPSLSVYPFITGQDNTEEARNLIKADKMSMTIDKSIKGMSYNTANLANMYVNGLTPASPVSFDNGVKKVPFFIAPATIITKDNL